MGSTHQLGSLACFASMGPASDIDGANRSQVGPKNLGPRAKQVSGWYQALLLKASNQQQAVPIKLEGIKLSPFEIDKPQLLGASLQPKGLGLLF